MMPMPTWIDHLLRSQHQRIKLQRLEENRVMGENLPATPMEPNKSYFQITLCEIHLKDQRELWRTFVPLGLAVSDFYYGGEKHSVPFIVGNNMLREVDDYLKGAYVDFRNTLVAGPVPYTGSNVGLFVGLIRLEVKDLAAGLFRLLGDVVGKTAGAGLTRYLELAVPLGQGLENLLGMQEVELRFGLRDEYTSSAGSAQHFRQGYLAYLNIPEKLEKQGLLVVNDGRLFWKKKQRMHPVDDCDYCLIKIEHLPERKDYANLPFYPLWEEAKKLLLTGETAKAQWKKVELMQQVSCSPDLTEDHSDGLIQFFEYEFEKKLARLNKGKVPASAATRGRGKNALDADPELHLQSTAARAQEAGASKQAVNRLMKLSKNYRKISKAREADAPTEAEYINRQLAALKVLHRGKPRPRELAEAITLSMLRQN